VVLVDADLRKPTLHEFFATPREPGFVDILVDPKRDLQDVLQQSEVPNLYLLPCGTMPPNPSELLGSSRAVEVMRCLQENADVVVYDSPPIATVTDAAVLAPHMDGVLQVVRAGATRIDMVRRSKAILEQVESRILGPVLNQVAVGDLGYYASYYYGYYRSDVDGGAQRLRWWRRYKRRKRGQPQPPSATLPDTKQI
jgi:capsular exopolysaccharide synthesis family protein